MNTASPLAQHAPVLVGIGVASRREEDPASALEPMDLMHEAVARAGLDCGSAHALAGTGFVAVPRGRWNYRNPAGEIKRAIGANDAVTLLSSVGVLQQSLIGEACARIARGESDTALVVGADAGYRLLRAQITGAELDERIQHDDPDIYLAPKDELRHEVEKRAGMQMPVGLYAILESAFRASHGWSVAEHRDQLANQCAAFSRVAAGNPHAWQRQAMDAQQIRDGSARNPMQAFPYTRAHCSTWNVDQAAALLLCSVERAQELGIPRERWVYPLASTESNHMVPVSARADLAVCPGARIAGRAALDAAGLMASDIDLVDLYSCFPLAVQLYTEALGLSSQRDLTFTGGMPYAGGPYNNYVFQATCRAAELLRSGRGRHALVSCVSGVVTKQAFGLWSMQTGPRGFVHADVSAAVADETRVRRVCDFYSGHASVAGFTVLHGRGQAPKAVVLADAPDGQRVMATSENPHWVELLQAEEWVGKSVQIAENQLVVT